MDQNNTTPTISGEDPEDALKILESPKPLTFTVDFGSGQKVDSQRHKTLVEKFQKKHRRGQSLSKIDEPPQSVPKKHPLTGNLPRKSSFQSEGYFSSDEKSERAKHAAKKRSELSLPLKNVTTESPPCPAPVFPNLFNSSETPDIELKDVSSPELDLVSPFSPTVPLVKEIPAEKPISSPECGNNEVIDDDSNFIDGNEYDFDKSDTVSDAGTYTLDADNYSEEQKARMSIDSEFKIEQVSVLKKTEDYIKSLYSYKENNETSLVVSEKKIEPAAATTRHPPQTPPTKFVPQQQCRTPSYKSHHTHHTKMLSPILSPTQNISITTQQEGQSYEEEEKKAMNMITGDNNTANTTAPGGKAFTKIMFPSPKIKNCNGLEQVADQGSVISVTSSGAFRAKAEKERANARRLSLTKSEVHVEAYVGDKMSENSRNSTRNLTANIVNVQSVLTKNNETSNAVDTITTTTTTTTNGIDDGEVISAGLVLGKISNLPPSGYSPGKTSPSKIPSPLHTLSRPRSRNSLGSPPPPPALSCGSADVDFLSDSSLDTESYLRSTQHVINRLQKKLSLEEHEPTSSSCDSGSLNNHHCTYLKQSIPTHIRHNSLDEKCIMKISNKLEHFQSKNLQQGIDQTMFNQYCHQVKPLHKIQNSPNNSPIRRSSSFSTNNVPVKNTNVAQKDSNVRNSPNLGIKNSLPCSASSSSNSMQRSASTASIKPNYSMRRLSATNEHHQKIDRNQYGDTESSSEEDFETFSKKKDLSNLTNTRYNRAFSLRRARLDDPSPPSPAATARCPNTPEMRRKFQSDPRTERAISVDRRPLSKTNEVQSRYLLNPIKKTGNVASPVAAGAAGVSPAVSGKTSESVKYVPKAGGGAVQGAAKTTVTPGKSQVFSRTDSGRFSMRTGKTTPTGAPKNLKKDGGKKSSGRSNSSLSSREKEFQNWKRRKSYDPMKAAAEGKRKEIAKRQSNIMTQSCTEAIQNQDCDSSPSHSSSVHRSQSFHGTAALEQLISSEEEDDFTLSADEGFSPPTPSPCDMSPMRANLKNAWKGHVLH